MVDLDNVAVEVADMEVDNKSHSNCNSHRSENSKMTENSQRNENNQRSENSKSDLKR